jgi:hypothetical protein
MDFDDDDDIVLDLMSERDCAWLCINSLVEEVIRERIPASTIDHAILRMQFRLVARRHPCETTSVGPWPVPPPDEPDDGSGLEFLDARTQPLSARRSELRKELCDRANELIYAWPDACHDAVEVLSRMRSRMRIDDPQGQTPRTPRPKL